MEEIETGSVYSWGWNEGGQLGISKGDSSVPILVLSFVGQRIAFISASLSHSAAITDTGKLWTFGKGKYGRLGQDKQEDYQCRIPKLVNLPASCRVVTVSCGHYHTAAVSAKGELYTWGRNNFGQLGHGNLLDEGTPHFVELFKGKKISLISCGGFHTIVCTEKHEIFTFGKGQSGELGLGDKQNRTLPTHLDSELFCGMNVQSISAGSSFTAAVVGRKLFTWGNNQFGQLGTGNTEDSMNPVAISYLNEHCLVQVSCGIAHTVCLNDNGHIYSFGCGENGQLGCISSIEIVPKVKQLIPARVKEALLKKKVTYVNAGGYHTACLTESGEVYIWGLNDFGQLGNNKHSDIEYPWHIRGPLQDKFVTQIACGGRHTLVTTFFQTLITIPKSSYISEISQFFNSASLSDISLIIQEKIIPSHKIILIRCDKFKTLFSSNPYISEIPILNESYNAFKCLIEYLYTDQINLPPLDENEEESFLVDLLALSRTYGASALLENLQFRISLGPEWKESCPRLSESLPSNMKQFFNNKLLSDISFDVDGKILYGHKLILAARSSHFKALFLAKFAESQFSNIHFDIKYSVFHAILEYIYTDNLNIQDDDAVEIMTTANEFNLDRLKAQCEDFIAQGVDIENVSWLFEISDRIDAKQLKQFCAYFLKKEYIEVSKTESFKNLSADLLKQISSLSTTQTKKKECRIQ